MEYYKEHELKKLQQIELGILNEIVRVCNQHSIKYFLIGGSALGAKRHQGFIPWDDDIDIGMTRANYNKFLKLAPSCLSAGYFLQTPSSEPDSPFIYAKIRKCDTLMMEWGYKNLNINSGIFIDIFPFDNIPDNRLLRKKQFLEARFLINIYARRQNNSLYYSIDSNWGILKGLLKKIFSAFLRTMPRKLILKRLNHVLTEYDTKRTYCLANLCFPVYLVDYAQRSTLFPLSKSIFEGKKYYVPRDLHTYLKSHYGEYWILPPEEKRVGHKPYKICIDGIEDADSTDDVKKNTD